MTDYVTHNTAVTHFVESDGLRYAYRALGPAGGVPLVFCHRFRGTMDDWDPAVVDSLAAERRVILFDNAGIGLSDGGDARQRQGDGRQGFRIHSAE
jgi:pimeloyl-ACP methyl ester carboxylesterase